MKYRSVLFVPGHEDKKIKKAYTLDADLVVIDLESTVPDDEKQNARNKYRGQRSLPTVAHLSHHYVGEVSVQTHTRRERHRPIGEQTHEKTRDSGRKTGTYEDRSMIHTGLRHNRWIDKDNVRHRKEGSRSSKHLPSYGGAIFL